MHFSLSFSLVSFAGISSTRDVSSASLYSSNTPKVFVLAAVTIGNPFPVIEVPKDNDSLSLTGKPQH